MTTTSTPTGNEEVKARDCAIPKALKRKMALTFLSRGTARIALEECELCDVLTFRRDMRSVEWEIKISKADLMSELTIIQALCAGIEPKGSESKVRKHRGIMNRSEEHTTNYFAFVVPEELISVARPVLERTKLYGLYSFFITRFGEPCLPTCVIKPSVIHTKLRSDFSQIAVNLCHRLYFPSVHSPSHP